VQFAFAFIHSPPVGTFTSSRVETEMQKRGRSVIAPRLHTDALVALTRDLCQKDAE
jgi:hypothetical protein